MLGCKDLMPITAGSIRILVSQSSQNAGLRSDRILGALAVMLGLVFILSCIAAGTYLAWTTSLQDIAFYQDLLNARHMRNGPLTKELHAEISRIKAENIHPVSSTLSFSCISASSTLSLFSRQHRLASAPRLSRTTGAAAATAAQSRADAAAALRPKLRVSADRAAERILVSQPRQKPKLGLPANSRAERRKSADAFMSRDKGNAKDTSSLARDSRVVWPTCRVPADCGVSHPGVPHVQHHLRHAAPPGDCPRLYGLDQDDWSSELSSACGANSIVNHFPALCGTSGIRS